jgi:serine/threonine protein phosphatase 1
MVSSSMESEMTDPIYYAIGDIHGRADHLSKTLDFIESDARYWGGRPAIYFLGDIVDRGSSSKQCLELVHATLVRHKGSRLHLGNHDAWFLDAVRSGGLGDDVTSWEHNGGAMTAHSFFPSLNLKDALISIRADHPHLVEMIANAHPMTSHGRLVFCHAGVDRFSPISKQDIDTLTWIRTPFLEIANDTDHVVVHGHTIFADGPIVTDNRISLDTGCYRTNRLSTLRVDPKRRTLDFIVSSDSGKMVEVDEAPPKRLQRGFGTALDRIDEIFDNWTEAA